MSLSNDLEHSQKQNEVYFRDMIIFSEHIVVTICFKYSSLLKHLSVYTKADISFLLQIHMMTFYYVLCKCHCAMQKCNIVLVIPGDTWTW